MRSLNEPVRVALAGCGAVGGAFAERVVAGETVGGDPVELTQVLVRSKAGTIPRPVPTELLTADAGDLLRASADLLVEAIGGIEPALTLARHMLARGGAVITANKALVRAHGAELARLAASSGGWFGYDAAVGGGVPVIATLRGPLAGQPVTSIRGILNGTANFVLTRLEAGEPLAAALAAARALGLAEADSSRDLDGRDVADKLAILAWVAWGIEPREVAVHRQGLLPDPAGLVRKASDRGGRLRLIGECRRTGDGIVAAVRPEIVAVDSPFGRTVGEQNRVELQLGWRAPLELAGPGAGGRPTAAALWGDLTAWRAQAGVPVR